MKRPGHRTRAQRHRFSAPVTMVCVGRRTSATLVDISETGLFFRSDVEVRPLVDVTIELLFPGHALTLAGYVARVARGGESGPYGVGVRFDETPPALRALIADLEAGRVPPAVAGAARSPNARAVSVAPAAPAAAATRNISGDPPSLSTLTGRRDPPSVPTASGGPSLRPPSGPVSPPPSSTSRPSPDPARPAPDRRFLVERPFAAAPPVVERRREEPRRAGPRTGADRREAARHRLKLVALVDREKVGSRAQVLDISKTGARIRVEGPFVGALKPKDDLRFRLNLRHPGPIEVYARVAWTEVDGTRMEVGLEFAPTALVMEERLAEVVTMVASAGGAAALADANIHEPLPTRPWRP